MLQTLARKILPLLRPRTFKLLRIGDRAILLDMRKRHEREYYRNPLTKDALIARAFIKPGDAVLDAGANIGFTALHYLACGARQVYACEPVPSLHRRLRWLAGDGMETFRLALADRSGEATMYLSEEHEQGHTLREETVQLFPAVFADAPRTIQVRLATVDDLFSTVHLDFMKIDVEGAEISLIDGARQTFEQSPPRIVQVEAYETTFADVHERLSAVFRYSGRVALHRKEQHLALLDPLSDAALCRKALDVDPPMYIYSCEPLELRR